MQLQKETTFTSKKREHIKKYEDMQLIIDDFLHEIEDKDKKSYELINEKNDLINQRINLVNSIRKGDLKVYNLYNKNCIDKQTSRNYLRFEYKKELEEDQLWTNVVKRVETEVINDADIVMKKLASKNKFIAKVYKIDNRIFEIEDRIDYYNNIIEVVRSKYKTVLKDQRAVASLLKTKYGFNVLEDSLIQATEEENSIK